MLKHFHEKVLGDDPFKTKLACLLQHAAPTSPGLMLIRDVPSVERLSSFEAIAVEFCCVSSRSDHPRAYPVISHDRASRCIFDVDLNFYVCDYCFAGLLRSKSHAENLF
jgi:hypothetical protein